MVLRNFAALILDHFTLLFQLPSFRHQATLYHFAFVIPADFFQVLANFADLGELVAGGFEELLHFLSEFFEVRWGVIALGMTTVGRTGRPGP